MKEYDRLQRLMIELRKAIGKLETDSQYASGLLDQVQALVYDINHDEGNQNGESNTTS